MPPLTEDTIESFRSQELAFLDKWRAGGGLTAGLSCRFFPFEIPAGFGIHPFRLLEGADFTTEQAGESLVRPDACSYCKSFLGNFSLKNSLHGMTDVLIGVVSCDMMRRTLDLTEERFSVPVFPIQMPSTRSENARDYYRAQLERICSDLSQFTGRSYSFSEGHRFYQSRRKAALLLLKFLSTHHPSPLVLHKLLNLFSVVRPEKLALFLEDASRSFEGEEIRKNIVIIGSPLCREDTGILSQLHNRGFGYVPLTCDGLSCLKTYTEKNEDSVSEELTIRDYADMVFDSPPCIRHRPNRGVYEDLRASVEEFEASGVILKCHKFCDLWYTEKQRMREFLDIPLLVVETTYSDSDRERQENRVDAFLETLA